MPLFFRNVTDCCITDEFCNNVIRKYHYAPEQAGCLREVVKKIRKCMQAEALWEHRMFVDEEKCPMAEVVLTLGAGVDDLQEKYVKQGLLSEAYMVEVLGSELLLQGYAAYNAWVEEYTSYHVARYCFLGSGERYSLEELPDMLKRMKVPITCNEAYCMIPKKSVAFYAILTEDEKVRCEGICVGCGSPDCPNRMEEKPHKRWNFADMTDRPLPYGYARIFGK